MADPFATGRATQHRGPRSVAAVHSGPAGENPVPIRVIRSQPTEASPFGRQQIVHATNVLLIQRIEVAAPKHGDVVTVGTERFQLQGQPKLDGEGLQWSCPAVEVPHL